MSYNVKIDKISTSYITRSRDLDDKWDNDDIAWSHDIRGFSVVGKNDYWDFVMTNDPKGKTLYLVYVIYNTGDSFHRENNAICLVGLYENQSDAKAVVNSLELDSKTNNEGFEPIKVKLPKTGVEETIGTSTWKGYFERVVSINCEEIEESFNLNSKRY
jgi:hypothetical protein